jgi:hypothetical protein
MSYIPKPFELAPQHPLPPADRAITRAAIAAKARAYRDALWAIHDAEAQVRWAKMDALSAEHIGVLETRLDNAYRNAQLLAGIDGPHNPQRAARPSPGAWRRALGGLEEIAKGLAL